MFGKKAQPPIKSLIAQGSRIEGNLKFTEGMRIDGEVVGNTSATASSPASWSFRRPRWLRASCAPTTSSSTARCAAPSMPRNCWNCSPRRESKAMCTTRRSRCTSGATITGQLRPTDGGEEKPLLKLAANSQ